MGLLLGACAAAAMADVVAVVSARNPTSALSNEQIADIFLGKSIYFPDGSRPVPIDQVEGAAARDEFYLTYAGKAPAQVKAHWSKIIFTGRGQPPLQVSSDADVKKQLIAVPNAIGYIDRSLLDSSVKALTAR